MTVNPDSLSLSEFVEYVEMTPNVLSDHLLTRMRDFEEFYQGRILVNDLDRPISQTLVNWIESVKEWEEEDATL